MNQDDYARKLRGEPDNWRLHPVYALLILVMVLGCLAAEIRYRTGGLIALGSIFVALVLIGRLGKDKGE